MLGSIDTGGFSEASKAAMMDSDYFNKPKKTSNPFSRGFNFLQDQISKLNKGDDEDDDKLSDYLKGKSYMPEKESSQDMLAKFILERGLGGGSGVQDVASGLTLTGQGGGLNQPIVVSGKEGSGGIGGAVQGAASGYLGSGFNPLGAVVGGIGGLFCDVRLKEDIAPLCESEVNDVLSECAFFVKDLNECS